MMLLKVDTMRMYKGESHLKVVTTINSSSGGFYHHSCHSVSCCPMKLASRVYVHTGDNIAFNRLNIYRAYCQIPCISGDSIKADEERSIVINDTPVKTTIHLVDEDGTVEEKEGIMMVF